MGDDAGHNGVGIDDDGTSTREPTNERYVGVTCSTKVD